MLAQIVALDVLSKVKGARRPSSIEHGQDGFQTQTRQSLSVAKIYKTKNCWKKIEMSRKIVKRRKTMKRDRK